MPPVTPVVGRLLFFLVSAFIIEKIAILFLNAPVSSLILHIGQNFHPTQILTHFFVSGKGGLGGVISLLFEAIILWSFGGELERLWGSYNFLRFSIVGILGGIFLTVPVGLLALPGLFVFGPGALIAAILVAYAIVWPDRQVLFFMVIPIRIKYLVIIMFILLAILGPINLIVFESGGALAGAFFLFYFARKGRLQQGYILSGASGKQGLVASIVDPIREKKRKKRLEKKRKEIEERIDMKYEVDRLLEKISKEGMSSLTRKEKAFLDRASKELP